MNADTVVRLAVAEDVPALARLRYEFRATLGPPTEDEATFAARCEPWMREQLANAERWRAWVAVQPNGTPRGTTVGTLWIGTLEKIPNPTPEPEEYAYVTNVYVRPEARKQGVASALVAAAMAWCEVRGVHAAFLWSAAQSAPMYRAN